MSSETAIETDIRAKARAHLAARGTEAEFRVIAEQVAAAFDALEAFFDATPTERAPVRTIPGEWSIQEVADHVLETHRPMLDEFRCLLAGRRPPGEAVPAALQSKAPLLRPWAWLRGEIKRLHADIRDTLNSAPPGFVTEARAPAVLVVNVKAADGTVSPVHWVEDLDWKAYAYIWRLHAVDHLGQVKKVRGAMR